MKKKFFCIADTLELAIIGDKSCSAYNFIVDQFQDYYTDTNLSKLVGVVIQSDDINLPQDSKAVVTNILYEASNDLYYVINDGIIKIEVTKDNFKLTHNKSIGGIFLYHVIEDLLRLYAPLHKRVFMHSSAFLINNNVYVISGFGGSGKTEIMLQALSKNASFISDDVAIYDEDGYIYPYTVQIPMKFELYDDKLLEIRNLSKKIWLFAKFCKQKNGFLTRRIYGKIQHRYYRKYLHYSKLSNSKTVIKRYKINKFIWIQNGISENKSTIDSNHFSERMKICMYNESRKYCDFYGFLCMKNSFLKSLILISNQMIERLAYMNNIDMITNVNQDYDKILDKIIKKL